jgi:hypothetical protein
VYHNQPDEFERGPHHRRWDSTYSSLLGTVMAVKIEGYVHDSDGTDHHNSKRRNRMIIENDAFRADAIHDTNEALPQRHHPKDPSCQIYYRSFILDLIDVQARGIVEIPHG